MQVYPYLNGYGLTLNFKLLLGIMNLLKTYVTEFLEAKTYLLAVDITAVTA
jgi:hypothetical protein